MYHYVALVIIPDILIQTKLSLGLFTDLANRLKSLRTSPLGSSLCVFTEEDHQMWNQHGQCVCIHKDNYFLKGFPESGGVGGCRRVDMHMSDCVGGGGGVHACP